MITDGIDSHDPGLARGSASIVRDVAWGGASARPRVSVVICTLDEHEAIGGVLDDVGANLAGVAHEIIVVDDSADDRTADVVAGRARRNRAIRLIRRQGAGGLASAAIAGWDAARGQTLAIMDGDGQHDPRLIGQMLRRMENSDLELVVASRYLASAESGLRGYRHLLSRAGVGLTGRLLGLRLADPMSGCFLMRRDWYEDVRPRLSGVGFKILVDVAASHHRRPRTAQTPTVLLARAGGESKLDLRVMLDLAALLVEKRTGGAVPARMSLFMLVGTTGLATHLTTLALSRLIDAPFWLGQGAAILAAMTTNFALNNSLTFRDHRLRGRAVLPGLLKFYVGCLAGALVSEAAGAGLNAVGAPWALAGAVGAVLGAAWNYHAARRLTWRAAHGPAPDAVATPPQAAPIAEGARP
jgi:dolichol-phosphate mannosyltransferase